MLLTQATAWMQRVAIAAHESLRARVAARRDDERGQGMVEYGLILVLIAVVVVIVVGFVGHQISNIFSNISSGLNK